MRARARVGVRVRARVRVRVFGPGGRLDLLLGLGLGWRGGGPNLPDVLLRDIFHIRPALALRLRAVVVGTGGLAPG